MNIIDKRPELFAKPPVSIWTDPYIRKSLLAVHLDPQNNAASRKPECIARTVGWIDARIKPRSSILDLGCGPGLYAEAFARKGHTMTGIDFNQASIEYARKQTLKNGTGIEYIEGDYISSFPQGAFDAIMMIYCDMGTHSDDERDRLMRQCHDALPCDGKFIFDVLKDTVVNDIREGTMWEHSSGPGFWTDREHLVLKKTHHFPGNRAFAYQYNIISDDNPAYFLIWERYYTKKEIKDVLLRAGFSRVKTGTGILHGVKFEHDHVMFVEAVK